MRPIRVLTIGHSYTIALNRAIVRELAKTRDFEITVVAPKSLLGDLRSVSIEPEPPASNLRLVALDVTFSQFPQLLGYDAVQLTRVVARASHDIVHIWAEPWTFSAHQTVHALGGKRALVSFWTFENIPRELPPPHCDFEREVVGRADAWLAGGRLAYETQVKRGYSAAKGHHVSPAVDRSVFRPAAEEQKCAVRRQLGLAAPVLGYAGRLTDEKGLHVLMSAVERIDPSLEWSLLVMGSGPMESEIIRWAKARHFAKRIDIRLLTHGEIPRYLPVVDMLLVPSQTRAHWKEQFGRVIVEAFACAVPVIASDSGEIPFVAGDAAKVLPESDTALWAATIESALRDPDSLRWYVERGLERCEQFSAVTTASRLGAVFRLMLATRSAR